MTCKAKLTPPPVVAPDSWLPFPPTEGESVKQIDVEDACFQVLVGGVPDMTQPIIRGYTARETDPVTGISTTLYYDNDDVQLAKADHKGVDCC